MAEVSVPGLDWLRKQLQEADPDLLRGMVDVMVATLMSAEADALCGAAYGKRQPGRINRRYMAKEGLAKALAEAADDRPRSPPEPRNPELGAALYTTLTDMTPGMPGQS